MQFYDRDRVYVREAYRKGYYGDCTGIVRGLFSPRGIRAPFVFDAAKHISPRIRAPIRRIVHANMQQPIGTHPTAQIHFTKTMQVPKPTQLFKCCGGAAQQIPTASCRITPAASRDTEANITLPTAIHQATQVSQNRSKHNFANRNPSNAKSFALPQQA